MKNVHIFISTCVFILTILLGNCGQKSVKTDKGIQKKLNLDSLETEFLNQVIFSDRSFDSLLVYEDTPGINFYSLRLRTNRLDSSFKSFRLVSDTEMIEIVEQCIVNERLKWTSEKLHGKKVFTTDEWRALSDETNKSNNYWQIFRKRYGKGTIHISKPIFFDNGRRAFFSYNSSSGPWSGNGSLCCYINKNGKWTVDDVISTSVS
jgi:hypothetical protein